MGKRGPARKPLTQIQKFAAFRLAFRQGMTMEEVAAEAEVSRMALWKWMQREDFQRECEREYKRMVRTYRSRWRR